MTTEKSLFFYGRPYHLVIDRMSSASRRLALSRIPERSSVIDVACGTGELALALRRERNCRVVGIDLSQRMTDFARKRNPYDEVAFVLVDAIEGLREFDEHSFDVAVVSQLLHEVTADVGVAILRAAVRVAKRTVAMDYSSPLSVIGPGAIPRLIEGTIGRDHQKNFLAYLASGGLPGVVERAGLAGQVVDGCRYNAGTGELVILSCSG